MLFDARFILFGSVIRYATYTSSEGERRRETVTDGVPFHSKPSLTDSQSGIAPLTLRSICAGPKRSRGFSSSVAATGFPPTATSPEWARLRSRLQSLRLHSVTQTPSAGSAHTSERRCPPTLIQPSVPEPERPSSLAPTVVPSGSCRACRLACSLSGRHKERCSRIALSDFLRVERRIFARSNVSAWWNNITRRKRKISIYTIA